MKVLDSGLKYAPDKELDKFEVYIDLQKFVRKLNIKKFFALNRKEKNQANQQIPYYKHSNLRNNSIFNPKTQQNESLVVFKKMVERDLRKINPNKTRNTNIWNTIKEIEKKKEYSDTTGR